MRIPAVDPRRDKLIRYYERKLAYFQNIRKHLRELEAADEGEATCRAMIAELRNPHQSAPNNAQPEHMDFMTMAEFLVDLEEDHGDDKR